MIRCTLGVMRSRASSSRCIAYPRVNLVYFLLEILGALPAFASTSRFIVHHPYSTPLLRRGEGEGEG